MCSMVIYLLYHSGATKGNKFGVERRIQIQLALHHMVSKSHEACRLIASSFFSIDLLELHDIGSDSKAP